MSKEKAKDDSIGHSVVIDQDRLDEEWLAQPNLMRRASRRLAELKKEVAHAKVNLGVVEADMSLRIRQRPVMYGLEPDKKPTVDQIAATVTTQREVIKAHEELIEATYLYDLAKADVDAIVHKKSALEDLVLLWTRDYFSSPVNKDPRTREKFEEQQGDKGRWKGRAQLRREDQE